MLQSAQVGGYAVGAFNADNMEMVQAIVFAAEEMNSPVIIQTAPTSIEYGGLGVFYAMVAAIAEKARIPIALNLDHGDSFYLARRALEVGYSSLMVDGSKKSFEENIEFTSSVVQMASQSGIPVEGELGRVGGKEDCLDGEAGDYTDPAEAEEFVKRTGVSALAIAIGTAHGVYKETPYLDIERLMRIRSVVDVPLVLHGASGLPFEKVCECIKNGICKVNISTELKRAYSDGIKEYILGNPSSYDPKSYGAMGRDFVRQRAKDIITMCGCADKMGTG